MSKFQTIPEAPVKGKTLYERALEAVIKERAAAQTPLSAVVAKTIRSISDRKK